MKIGVLKERREPEDRVAASPDTVKRYRGEGHEVLVEQDAGAGSMIADDAFAAAGATILAEPGEVCAAADILLKVQRPLEEEMELGR